MRRSAVRYEWVVWVVVFVGAVVALALPVSTLLSGEAEGSGIKRVPSGGSTASAPSTSAAQPKRGPLFVGVTHTQFTIEPWDDQRARRVANGVLKQAAPVQNQFIMGWGALNPEPRPGVYNWRTLDQRMALIAATGGTPVVTLCCAPDWMKGGKPGQTNWKLLGRAPDADHYDDFARLAVAVAKRYPTVRHYVVWSELRGFYDPATNNWDMDSYTKMYNQVYTALKKHNPRLKVGGPSPVMDSWADASTMSDPSDVRGPWGVLDQRELDAIDYWLANKAGADFFTLNATTANRYTGRAVPVPQAVEKFRAIGRWIQSRTDLPQWWMEVYSPAADLDPTKYSNWIPATPGSISIALSAIKDVGGHVALLWNPQGKHRRCTNCLWTWPGNPEGPEATKFVPVLKAYADRTKGRTP